MTKSKNTKRALLASIISMLMCFTMLIGSTFAWFTDTATTNVNKIQAGTLKIALEMYDEANGEWVDAEGKTLEFVKSEDAPEGEAILWEPGVTYKLPKLRVRNDGNLALKFMVEVTGIDGDAKLNEAIEWEFSYDMTEGNPAAVDYQNDSIVWGLYNKGDFLGLNISGHMKEEAGNEYQGLSIEGCSITVVATQLTAEYDSNNNTYDESATYPTVTVVESQYQLDTAIANATAPITVVLSDGTYKLPAMTNKEVTLVGGAGAVIDTTAGFNSTNGATITFDGVTVNFKEDNYQGFAHAEKVVYKDATINGQQTLYAPEAEFINCTFNIGNGYNIWTYGAEKVTFTDCTFKTQGRAIMVYNEMKDANFVADITLNNCEFIDDGTYVDPKAAVETGSNGGNTATSNKYNLTFNNCITSGFETNNSTDVLWGNKNSMDTDHLNVVINGADVY